MKGRYFFTEKKMPFIRLIYRRANLLEVKKEGIKWATMRIATAVSLMVMMMDL